MKQVFIKKGGAVIRDVPAPVINKNEMLVKVLYSCISIGTESVKVNLSSRPIYKKILDQPQYIDKVKKQLLEHGLKDTVSRIRNKVENESPIGYSLSGIVVQKGDAISRFNTGDRVACAGDKIANHADFVSVGENLTVLISKDLALKEASTVALGSIALQGIRRCNPNLGDFIVVVGLGFLGQITLQMLKASGCRVLGIDIDQERLDKAFALGLQTGINPNVSNVVEETIMSTRGHGADAVIITASSSKDILINQAMSMCRKKGKIVIVGGVSLNINRDILYEKELDLLISTSYGPGRYDDNYEVKGLDYPYSYVRWTENRNMQEYLNMLAEKKISLNGLIDDVVRIDDVPAVYEVLKSGGKKPILALIEYEKEIKPEHKIINTSSFKLKSGQINVGLIGSGGFAKDIHIPNLRKLNEFYKIHAVCDKIGGNADQVSRQVSAGYSTTNYEDILNDKEIDLVFIATRHDLHAKISIEALLAGKAVFVEKPMALNESDLSLVSGAIEKTHLPYLVGFNRRFSTFSKKIFDLIKNRTNPLVINYRVNAGFIPKDIWVQSAEGGGRNIGEACHIYDLFTFFTASQVKEIRALSIKPATEQYMKNDNFTVIIKFMDGSVCNLVYTALGAPAAAKELMEIYFDNKIIRMNDFREVSFFGIDTRSLRSSFQEKGHFEELLEFGKSIKSNEPLIPLWQLVQATNISFEVEKQINGV